MVEIVDSPPAYKSLTSEEVIFVKDMIQEFETEGVHIKGKKDRIAVASLQVTVVVQDISIIIRVARN